MIMNRRSFITRTVLFLTAAAVAPLSWLKPYSRFSIDRVIGPDTVSLSYWARNSYGKWCHFIYTGVNITDVLKGHTFEITPWIDGIRVDDSVIVDNIQVTITRRLP